MKKTLSVIALVILGGALFAQAPGPGMGTQPGQEPQNGPMMGIDWKIGTVVTTEYKKVSGQLAASTSLWGNKPIFKADGVEYQLRLPRIPELANLKSGDTVTIEGLFTTVKGDTTIPATVHAFKITVNGKEIDVAAERGPKDGPGRGMGQEMGQGMGPNPHN